MKKKVVMLSRYSTGYRVPFYEQLYESLKNRDVELTVVLGQPARMEKLDLHPPESTMGYLQVIRNRYLYFGNRFIVWQPALRQLRGADLIIVTQHTRNLINYPLMLFRKPLGYKLAYWGHGRNFQATTSSNLAERLKRFYSVHADHWFAYTELSADIIRHLGFPEHKISIVDNTIDTNDMVRTFERIRPREVEALRREYGIGERAVVGILCSGLYAERRIDFLLRCVNEVKGRVKDFHFVVIGDGAETEVNLIKTYAAQNPGWFHYVGPRYGYEKLRFFKLADFQLMPGKVGLQTIDAFATLTPLITTASKDHCPEIAYFENHVNGLMTEDSVEAYVRGIMRVINDRSYLETLVEGCKRARARYTIENMVTRFADGIFQALSVETNGP